jgi:hypothetical protein
MSSIFRLRRSPRFSSLLIWYLSFRE